MHFTSSLSRAASMLVELSAGWLVVLCTNAAAVRRAAAPQRAATTLYGGWQLNQDRIPFLALSKNYSETSYTQTLGLRPRESSNVCKTFFWVGSPIENNSSNSFDENVSKLVYHC